MAHQIFNLPPQQPLSAAGRVLPGSKLYFYESGTSTPAEVYTTSALNVAHTQPLIANAGGRFDTVYLDPSLEYKATVTDTNDVLLYTIDPVNDQILSQAVIGEYLYPRTAAEISAGVTPVNYAYAPYFSKRYGAVGDGATDDTEALQKGIDATPDRQTFKLEPDKNFLIGALNVTDKNITIDSTGARVTMVGDNAGLYLHGTITRAEIIGWSATGDNTNRDADTSLIQVGISVGNEPGDNIQDVTIIAPRINQANVGIRVSYGTSPNTTVPRVTIIDPRIFNSVGYAGGAGYGIQFTQAPGSCVLGGYISGCQRHGLYFAEGEDYRAIGVEVTGCGKNDGTIRSAFSISRSRNVVAQGCYIHDNGDVGMGIDTDSQGITPKDLRNVLVDGCLFDANLYGDIRLGSSTDPATDGYPALVDITNCRLKQPNAAGASPVVINQAFRLTIDGLTIDASDNTSGSSRLITMTADGGAAYTDEVVIRNVVCLPGSNTAYAFEIDSDLCGGTSKIKILDVVYNGLGYSLGAAITNPNFVRSPFSSSYTATLTAVTGTVTGDVEYTIHGGGELVTVEIPQIIGASPNTTQPTLTGMPVEIRPSETQTLVGINVDNSVSAFGKCEVASSGVISIYNALSSSFTAANNKGTAGFSHTWRRG